MCPLLEQRTLSPLRWEYAEWMRGWLYATHLLCLWERRFLCLVCGTESLEDVRKHNWMSEWSLKTEGNLHFNWLCLSAEVNLEESQHFFSKFIFSSTLFSLIVFLFNYPYRFFQRTNFYLASETFHLTMSFHLNHEIFFILISQNEKRRDESALKMGLLLQ